MKCSQTPNTCLDPFSFFFVVVLVGGDIEDSLRKEGTGGGRSGTLDVHVVGVFIGKPKWDGGVGVEEAEADVFGALETIDWASKSIYIINSKQNNMNIYCYHGSEQESNGSKQCKKL